MLLGIRSHQPVLSAGKSNDGSMWQGWKQSGQTKGSPAKYFQEKVDFMTLSMILEPDHLSGKGKAKYSFFFLNNKKNICNRHFRNGILENPMKSN